MQLRDAFAAASDHDIPYVVRGRRLGDVAVLIADPNKVASEWNWRTTHDLDAMCRDAWRFHSQNPHGYETPQKVISPHCGLRVWRRNRLCCSLAR